MVTMWQLKMYLKTRSDISQEVKAHLLKEIVQFAEDGMIASGDVELALGMDLGRAALHEIGRNPRYWQLAIAEIKFRRAIRTIKKFPYQCSIFQVCRTSTS